MRIVLVRHGRPDAAPEDRRPIPGTDIGHWCRRYNELGITPESPPPTELREIAESTEYIAASDRRRAVESARLLAGAQQVHVDADLREAGLPETLNVRTRLHPGAWVATARITWLLGYGNADETATAAQQRAARVAARLRATAHTHESVLVVGHGWFNRLVAIELRRHGWQGPRLIRIGYWASATYSPVNP